MPVRNREATDANVSAVNRAVRYVPRELASSPQGGPCADAEDGIRDAQESRGLGDVYKRQLDRLTRTMSKAISN